MKYSLNQLGLRCKLFRIAKGYTQKQVADELNYSRVNITAFENGRSNNCLILLWYLQKGMTL